jgi:hypothetical protein
MINGLYLIKNPNQQTPGSMSTRKRDIHVNTQTPDSFLWRIDLSSRWFRHQVEN